MVKTHAAGNLGTIFDLEILNTGSIPAKNIRLKAEQKDIDKALGKDSTTENKTRWLSCFDKRKFREFRVFITGYFFLRRNQRRLCL